MPVLSSQQRADAKEAFTLYDKDSDGKISVEELGQVVRAFGRNPTNDQVTREGNQVADNTGAVTFDGYIKVLEKLECKADNEEEVKEAFRVFDKDQTGFVPISELRYSLVTLGEKLPTDEVDALLRGTFFHANIILITRFPFLMCDLFLMPMMMRHKQIQLFKSTMRVT